MINTTVTYTDKVEVVVEDKKQCLDSNIPQLPPTSALSGQGSTYLDFGGIFLCGGYDKSANTYSSKIKAVAYQLVNTGTRGAFFKHSRHKLILS